MIPALTLAALLALPSSAAPTLDDSVRYTIAPVLADQRLAGLSVEIRFAGDPDGETDLHLPRQWAGSGELWRHLTGVEVEGAQSVREEGPALRRIAHRPGAPLTVRYRVQSAYPSDPGFDYEKARPLILPGWFFFHGEGVFAVPDGRQEAPAQFAWKGFPADWKLASDLDHLAGVRPGTVEDVIESAAIGGPDLQVLQRDIDGAPFRVAIRGAWSFSPEAFADAVEKIIRAENALWESPARPFFVPVAPLGGEGSGHSRTGTGRGDAFSVASTPSFELADAQAFLAHEYLHTWIPLELGGTPEQDEAVVYWFGEGFTDYYAAQVLLRAGLRSQADHAAELSRTLMRYGTSSARNATAAVVLRDFWTDPAVHQHPYDQGHLLAHLLEHRIRQASEGRKELRDVLLAQLARARRNAQEGRKVPAADLFLAVLREETGLDVASDLARYIRDGQPVVLPPDLLGDCFQVTTVTQPEFHRGFDAEATQQAGGILTGVRPESPAHAAGLRDGMRLVRREAGEIGDSSVEIVYRVQEEDVERVIRYMPQGPAQVTFQRVLSTEKCQPPSTPDSFIASYAAEHNFNGSILIQKDGKISFAKSFGLANIPFKVPNTRETKYKIASITKLFTSTLILQLQEQGKLDLGKTIGTYLPDYAGEGADKVTLHQLLNHTSGLTNLDTVKDLETALRSGIPYYQTPYTSDQLLANFCGGKLVNVPGQVFDYNNCDYLVLGKIIERLSGKTWEEALKTNILQPLGMKNTGMLRQGEILDRLADTYFFRPDLNIMVNDLPMYPENWYAAGGMYSTVDDVLTFANALFGGKLLKAETLALLSKPGLDDYGYGLWSYEMKIAGKPHRVVKRPGQIMGAQTQLFHLLDDGVTIVILSNTGTADLDEFVAEIGKRVIGGS